MGLLSTLLVGALATTYADTHGVHPLTYPLPHGKQIVNNVASPVNNNKSSTVSGSAHQGVTGQTAPNSNLPAFAGLRTASCTLFPPKNPGLASALSPQLRKLAQYEQLCNGALVDRTSFFVPTPTTVPEAQSDAADVVAQLKEFATFGVKPLVFMEPNGDNGIIDLNQYHNGAYDLALDAYFAAIKSAGVTDSMMGIWVLMPEGNLPVWNNVDPDTYATNVTKTAQFQKKYFPTSQSAVLLDSETYDSGASWGNGKYISLLQYVKAIPKGLIDSFGLQGFPWAPPANQGGDKVYDPNTYLRVDFAAEAARALGTENIWFNTGTFSRMYTQNSSQTVTASPTERQSMLSGVLSQAKSLQAQGFTVDVHFFAEDKSSTSEAIDWSYWHTQPINDANTAVFTTFVHDATVANIRLWLFDSDEH